MGPCIRTSIISLFLLKHSNSIKPYLSPAALPVFSYSSSSSTEQTRISLSDYLEQRHQLSPDTVSKLLSTVLKRAKDPEKCNSVLSFFKGIGFSDTQLDKMLNCIPTLIRANVDRTVKPKIKAIQDLGLSPKQIAEVVSINPWNLQPSTSSICSRIRQVQKIMGNNLEWFVLLRKCYWLMTTNLENTLVPNVEFLKTKCGIDDSQIVNYIYQQPRVLIVEHEFLKKCVEMADQMGLPRHSKNYMHGIWSVSTMSVEKWKHKLDIFRSLGFSEDDIRSVFRRNPKVFATSERKIKEVTKVLQSAGYYDISFIVKAPILLTLSVEKRLKPRLQILEVLETKNLLGKKPSLSYLFSMTNEKFLKRYVLPHSADVGTIKPL